MNLKRTFSILLSALLIASLTLVAMPVQPAYAASIVVNSNADDTLANLALNATCDLREAIENANNDNNAYSDCAAGSGADTITFAGNYDIVIYATQLPTITTEIIITGNGAANSIIRVNGQGNPALIRVFEVSAAGNLTLDGLTIKDGNCVDSCPNNPGKGGGIYNSGTVKIINSTLSNNLAGGSPAVTNAAGGGIYNNGGSVTVTNSNLNNNYVSNSNPSSGGGIYNAGGTVSISNSTFSGNYLNSSASNGGGIYQDSGTLTITESTFTSNHSYGSGYGGGIFINGGTAQISGSTFNGNTAVYQGGGIYNKGTLSLSNSTLSGNSAINGGGMYNSNSGTTVNNVTFSANSASGSGGIGGAVYNNSSNPAFTNTTFANNSAENGGAMFNISSNPSITNATFSGNSATGVGGGIYNDNSHPTLINVTMSGNSASSVMPGIFSDGGGGGGGIFNEFGGATFINVIIANSPSGGDCENYYNYPTVNATNSLIEDGLGCVNGTNSNNLTGDPNLIALADNGGFTQTMALSPLSIAIDTGTSSGAPSTDQRGVTRPQSAGYDIGAYESGPIIPVVTASNPSANAVLTSLSSITVVFNQDMLDDATAKGAENVSNYILVERGTNASFDTTSCNGGVVSDDVQQTISSASYNSFVASLTLAAPLTNGTYRLFVCGTTSVWSAAGLELNNGTNDYTVDFTISAATGTGTGAGTETTSASSLPKTGFAPKQITTLPPQPADLAYANLGDLWLEIPSLNVKSSIVGVPQNADKSWDVSWLGNDTGWLNGTAFPTWNGNSVLTAHVTNASGLDGPFAALKSLRYGDQIIVHFGGAKYVYEVRNTRLARPYSVNYAFESLQDHSYLTLITCQGYNPLNETYLFRRVVRAVLVSVENE